METLDERRQKLIENRHPDIDFTEKLLKKYIPLYEIHDLCNFYVDKCVNDENDEKLFYDNLTIEGDKTRVDFIWTLINHRNEPHLMMRPITNLEN